MNQNNKNLTDFDNGQTVNLNLTEAAQEVLSNLNAEQKQAVEIVTGPLLVTAGAGTGKTKVIVSKVAYLYLTGCAQFDNMLVVTFTNKAAQELVERINSIVPDVSTYGLTRGTFHAISTQILREHSEAASLIPNFSIIDRDDQLRALRQALDYHNIDPKKYPVRRILEQIEQWKNLLLAPEDKKTADSDFDFVQIANRIYKTYEKKLADSNAVDFSGLIYKVTKLFEKNPDILRIYQDKIRYVLVDEYQDVNYAQSRWIEFFAKGHNNLTCVGDEDQLIYSWRGADIKYFMDFEDQYEGAKVVKLETNYRSNKKIIKIASNLISHNKKRHGKVLKAATESEGRIYLHNCFDMKEEAEIIAKRILSLTSQGISLNDFAVLVRTQSLFRIIEDKFIEYTIPYQIFGGVKFYDREEVKDVVSYLKLISNQSDNFAFDRIHNKPRRGLGKVAYQQILKTAEEMKLSYFDALKFLVDNDKLPKATKVAAAHLVLNIKAWQKQIITAQIKHNEIVEIIIDESGYSSYLKSLRKEEYANKLDNLKELMSAMKEHSSLEAFLQHVALISELDAGFSDQTVKLLTIHSAKGLEFDKVFLPAFVEDIMPHKRTLNESGLIDGLEEERRLAYVAITRAKSEVCISYSKRSSLFGEWGQTEPSRFLKELETSNISSLSKTNNNQRFKVGEECFHNIFGNGVVIKLVGDFATVKFSNEDQHTILSSFLKKMVG